MEITILHKAVELPEDWDLLAEDCFQTREFLHFTEKYNPCSQRYYLLFKEGIFTTGAVVYTLRPDLLTYLSIPSPLRMNIAGIPCSVSASGIIGDRQYLPQLSGHMKIREKGMLLFLNTEPDCPTGNMIRGRTLPTIIMMNPFPAWDEYFRSLRADYRRRLGRITSDFEGIRKTLTTCAFFDEPMYRQYLEVLKHSKGKLETLNLEFFRNLPQGYDLTAFYHSEKLIGWMITTTFRDKFYFFMGGIDYQLNGKYSTYFNILVAIVREGIEKGAAVIDLGQTAEIPKVRLGGRPLEKTMLATHSNPLFRALLHAGRSLLEYKNVVKETHVFKKTG